VLRFRFGRAVLTTMAALVALGAGTVMGRAASAEARPGTGDVVATVNGERLTRAAFEEAYQQIEGQARGMGQPAGGIERVWTTRLEALQTAARDAAIMQEAKAKGITVSEPELRARIDQLVDQDVNALKVQARGQAPQQLERAYAWIAARQGHARQDSMSEGEFRSWYAELLGRTERAQLELQVVTERLRNLVTPLQPMTEEEARAAYDEVTARQIVVALTPPGKPARTDAEAKQRAEELLARIRRGADFGTMARAESDDPEAQVAGGLMDAPLSVRSLDPEWKRQITPLQAGEVVKAPIRTSYGYAIVKVEKRQRRLPPEFEENKEQEIKSLAAQEQQLAWARHVRELMAKAKIEVSDPELLGYGALREGKTEEGLRHLRQATEAPEKLGAVGAAAAFYEMAVFTSARNEWAKAADLYARADKCLREGGLPQSRVQILLGLGRAQENLSREYAQQGKTQEAAAAADRAAEWYTLASKATEDRWVHEQLQATFARLQKPDLAEREGQIVAQKRQQEEDRNKALVEQQKAMERNRPRRPTGPSPIAPE